MTATHNMEVPNTGFAAFRTSLNIALKAATSNTEGSSAPATELLGQFWVDSSITPWVLNIWDGGAWIKVGELNAGTNVFMPWGAVAGRVQAKSALYTVSAVTDRGELHTQSGTYTVTLPAAATAGAGWSITLMNIGTGTITIDGDAAETINGIATYVMALQHVAVHLVCDGSNWVTATHAPRLHQGALFGLGLTNNGAQPLDDLDIAAGHCYGTGDTGKPDADIKLAAITKQIDANWTAGTNAGGLATTLTVANDTWYHVHAIIVAGASDVGFDTDIAAATLIAQDSATHYRRIGSVLTDGSANIIKFIQFDNMFMWDDPPRDISVTDQSTTGVTRVLSTPLGVRCLAFFTHTMRHASGNAFIYFRQNDVLDETPSASNTPLAHMGATHYNVQDVRDVGYSSVLTDLSSSITTRSNLSTTEIRLALLGWNDPLGRMS